MPERPNGGGLPSDQLLERAREYHFRETLTPAEYEALMDIGGELINPYAESQQCFILGSYDKLEKNRLIDIKRAVNNRSGPSSQAYLMEDLADDIHPVVQFKIIADYSDHIIGVCEHDQGGFQLELGMLLAITRYGDKCHLLKRTYEEDEREHYNWMLDAGAFELFNYQGRLYEWENKQEFNTHVMELLSDILNEP